MTPVVLPDAVQTSGEVLSRRRAGAYHALTMVAPEVAERARPGQFLMIAPDPGSRSILRRPFSIAGAHARGPQAGAIEIVFDAIGTGTEWLAGRRPHDRLSIVGPLGRPFAVLGEPGACILVGGGYGAAPLLFLADALRLGGCRIDMVLGAATEGRLLGSLEAKRLSETATFTTEDGSLGHRGLVTDVLGAVIDRAAPDVVYACGPMRMLEAVAKVASGAGVPCQVSVEEFMGCGVGVCWTCVVPVRTSRGIAMVRACTEGPVLDGEKVVWR